MRNTKDTSGFYGSIAMLGEQDHAYGAFDGLVAELGEMLRKADAFPQQRETLRARSVRRTSGIDAEFTALLAKALPKLEPKRVVAIKAHPVPVRDSELMAKAVGMLRHDSSLSAHDRGMLMLGVSAAHDRAFAKAQRTDAHPVTVRPITSRPLPAAATVAKAFSALRSDQTLSPAERGSLMLGLSETADAVFKSEHPTVTKIDAALRLLERAQHKHVGAEADRLINSLVEAIRRGEVHDNVALESRLRAIRNEITKESEDGDQN